MPSASDADLSSRTWLAPVTLATRADEAGGPPFKVLRDLGQPPEAALGAHGPIATTEERQPELSDAEPVPRANRAPQMDAGGVEAFKAVSRGLRASVLLGQLSAWAAGYQETFEIEARLEARPRRGRRPRRLARRPASAPDPRRLRSGSSLTATGETRAVDEGLWLPRCRP
jgi:hypothetical protein